MVSCYSVSVNINFPLESGLSCTTLFKFFFFKLGLTVGNRIVLFLFLLPAILKVVCVTFKKHIDNAILV